jgi:predicted transcriptional regulator
MIKITPEQRQALEQAGSPVEVEDDETQQVYFLVDKATVESADRDAIRRGIADMEAGRVVTLEELDARIRARLRPSS